MTGQKDRPLTSAECSKAQRHVISVERSNGYYAVCACGFRGKRMLSPMYANKQGDKHKREVGVV